MFSSFKEYARYGTQSPSTGADQRDQGVFLGIRPTKPGFEVVLPSLGTRLPEFNRQQKESSEETDEPSLTTALTRMLVFYELTKPGKSGTGESAADKQQQRIIDATQRALHSPVPLLIPDETNINSVTSQLIRAIDSVPLLPDEIITDPEQFELHVHNHAIALTNDLYSEQNYGFNQAEPTHDEEKAVAHELWLRRHRTTPYQRRSLLRERVFDRAEDAIAKEKSGTVLIKLPQVRNRYDIVKKRPPAAWIVNDFLTSELMLTPGEQSELENIVWGLTAENLLIRDIRGDRDMVPIPLSRFLAPDGLLLTTDQPDYLDTILKKAGRLRPLLDRYISPTSVGRLKIESLGRKELVGQFTVRNAGAARAKIIELATRSKAVDDTIRTMSSHVSDQDPNTRFLIRPQRVSAAIPDPAILYFDPIDRRSRAENTQLITGEIRAMRKQAKMLFQQLKSANHLINGEPINTADAKRIAYLKDRYEAALKRYQLLTNHTYEEDLKAGNIKPVM
jgi:hypothetical protein